MAPIKMTYQEINASGEAVRELAGMKLPVKGALHVLRIMRALSPLMEDYHKVRHEKIGEFCKRGEDGELLIANGKATISEENMTDAMEAFRELDDLAVEVDAAPLTVDELGDIEIEPGTLLALGALLDG